MSFENDVKTYSIQTNRSSVMYILGQLLVYGLILFVIYLILSYGAGDTLTEIGQVMGKKLLF